MAPRYRKIDPRIWTDEKFRQLTSEEQRTAMYILTAQCNRIGLFSFSPGKACEDLRISITKFRKSFEKVCQTLGWHWDSDARVLYLPTWWKYNPPESTNNLVGNLKDLRDLPSTSLLARFAANTRYVSDDMKEMFSQVLSRGYPHPFPDSSPHPSRSQEQEKEQKQDQERNTEIISEKQIAKAFLPEKKCAHQLYEDACEAYAMPGSKLCNKHKARLLAHQNKHGIIAKDNTIARRRP